MAEIYIDASNLIAGRIGAYVAKRALLGDTVKIMNSEKAVISGPKENTIEKYHYRKKYLGSPKRGPIVPALPDRFLKRIIRGMLPHKKAKGKEAFNRIMCYISVPVQFKDQKLIKIQSADASKLKVLKSVTIGEICHALCAR